MYHVLFFQVRRGKLKDQEGVTNGNGKRRKRNGKTGKVVQEKRAEIKKSERILKEEKIKNEKVSMRLSTQIVVQ